MENCPEAQGTHVAAVSAPLALEYVPAGHKEQELLPGVAAYLPASQKPQLVGMVAPAIVE